MIEIYENILLEQEQSFLISLIETRKQFLDKPTATNRNYSRINITSEEVNTHLKKFINNIPYIFEKDLFVLTLVAINFIDKDNYKDDNYHTDSTDMTFITYLNDNFTGGEFEYLLSDKTYTIKPKKNLSILINSKVKHRVLPVTEGTRYSLVCFFKAKENLQKKLI